MRNATLKAKAPLTGLALTALVGATLQGGNAHAILSCTFANLSSCNGTLGNVTFSSFTLGSSTGFQDGDAISILDTGNSYSVIGTYFAAPGDINPLSGSGSFSFTATSANGYTFSGVSTSSSVTGPQFTFTSTLSGFTPSTLVNPPSPNTATASSLTTTNVVVAWSDNASVDVATASALTLTTSAPTGVPAPLPLFGAAAAFSLSRRLRQRQKALA